MMRSCAPRAARIRMPTVIVAVNYARVSKKRPKLSAKNIHERDGNRCQYTGVLLHPDEGSLDHVVPRSRGGGDSWENLVWSAKDVNQRKADRLPHEAGLKLLAETVPEGMKQNEARNGRKTIAQGQRRNASAALGNQPKTNQAL